MSQDARMADATSFVTAVAPLHLNARGVASSFSPHAVAGPRPPALDLLAPVAVAAIAPPIRKRRCPEGSPDTGSASSVTLSRSGSPYEFDGLATVAIADAAIPARLERLHLTPSALAAPKHRKTQPKCSVIVPSGATVSFNVERDDRVATVFAQLAVHGYVPSGGAVLMARGRHLEPEKTFAEQGCDDAVIKLRVLIVV
jgi:hypothetical protein